MRSMAFCLLVPILVLGTLPAMAEKPYEGPTYDGDGTGDPARICNMQGDPNLCLPLDETWTVVDFSGAGECSGPANPADPCRRNDDDYSFVVPLGFNFDLYGAVQTEVYINNNGNLSFDGGYCTYTPTGFPVDGFPMHVVVKDEEGNSLDAGEVNIPSGTINLTFDSATGKVDTAASTDSGVFGIQINPAATGFSEFSTPVEVDFSALTLFSGNTTVEATAGDADGLGAGNKAGSISGYEVGTDGKILGRYTNGETKLLGQITIATFQNPAGLQKIGNNLFEATNNSGEFDGIGVDVTSNGGSFNAGVLEMSNVDLSKEFTEMITTQRGFQANSRIITSSDEMLQELVNLKR